MKGLDYDALFPGRFVKAGDFKGKDVTLTISSVRIEDLPNDAGGNKVKGIIGFEGKKKEWVLNRTNGEALKAMWGRDTGEWVGKRVTLYPAMWNSDPCIRVRGSPDLQKPLKYDLKLPRKRPIPTTLVPTGKNGKAALPAPEPEPEPEPEPVEEPIVDQETGESF